MLLYVNTCIQNMIIAISWINIDYIKQTCLVCMETDVNKVDKSESIGQYMNDVSSISITLCLISFCVLKQVSKTQ